MQPSIWTKFVSWMMVALFGVALASCGERERDVDLAAEQGILLMGNGSEPKSIDPHLVTGVTENKIIQALIEGLIAYHPDDDTEPAPGVAESWESNADYTRWTFTLRDNARWTNGDPVVAGDFVYSWQRMLSPALGAEYAEMLYVVDNAEAYHQGDAGRFRPGWRAGGRRDDAGSAPEGFDPALPANAQTLQLLPGEPARGRTVRRHDRPPERLVHA